MDQFVVVAFGGNAILPSGQRGTLAEQRLNVRRMAEQLASLVASGHKVVVTHGNGPQVGEIMLKSELSKDVVPPLTLDVAGAMSQGQIGYMLQQEISNLLNQRGQAVVCSLVTQVEVAANDPAFQNPTKPIGRFFIKEEADQVRLERGWHMVEDAGRGYRRVVPSPRPLRIVEWPAVKALVESGALVIAAGGGGVPVVVEDGMYRGVEAVIDKDLAARALANLVGARVLVLLTEVSNVSLDYGTDRQRTLNTCSLEEMKVHLADGQFPPGSMGPKVQAAIEFLEQGGDRAIITSPALLVAAVNDSSVGTQVVHSALPPQNTSATLAGRAS